MKQGISFKIILSAMFASMVCVCTICLQIPSPMGGYINPGDAIVLLSAFILGPWYGAAAAGLGSALADLLTGYAFYAPGTLVIKGLTALVAALLLKRLMRREQSIKRPLAYAVSGAAGEIIMVAGYLLYAWFCLSRGAAALASVPGNLAQGAFGIIAATLLTPLITKPREVQELLEKFRMQ